MRDQFKTRVQMHRPLLLAVLLLLVAGGSLRTGASGKPYVVLQRSGVRAVIVNNEAVNDDVLPGHRAGYSGVASLTHRTRSENLFVPLYAGLNFEHIHDGTVQPREILFEPRNAPMEIRQIDTHAAELHQPPTPHWQLESWLRYELLADGVIELTLECIPRARTFKNDTIGLFFASYIHQPESLDIHFQGRAADDEAAAVQWIRGVTPAHGTLATHLALDDHRVFAHDPEFPMTLVFNRSRHRYAISNDLNQWTPKGALANAPAGRDPSVIVWDGAYHIVVCGRNEILMARSDDLVTCGETRSILKMKDGIDPESPSIVRHNGVFYLFVCGWNGQWDKKDLDGAYQHVTYVYQSDDPSRFDADQEIARLDAHAPEIFQDEEGNWFISSVQWPHRGVSIAPLAWE